MNSICFLLLYFFFSCAESKDFNDKIEAENEEVTKTKAEFFIEQLINDNYLADTLPKFKSDAIPILLEYANDFRRIENFPLNPIASHIIQRTIGESILWTIEYIRLYEGKYLENIGYPSLIPKLNVIGGPVIPDSTSLTGAYILYYNWWYDHDNLEFEEFRHTKPLEGSRYRWR